MTVRVSWARCPECGWFVQTNNMRFAHHTTSDDVTTCRGAGLDARASLADVIRSDIEQFEAVIRSARETIREQTARIKSARKQLAELERKQ